MKINERYYPIDSDTLESVKLKISKLAKAYTPEWVCNLQDPDIGAALALVFADMMNDNAHKMNMVLYKYHIELMNMLGLSLWAAEPAKAVVVFSLLNSAPGGVFVEESAPLLANPDGEERIVFETDCGVFLTTSKITNIFSLLGRNGRIAEVYPAIASEDDGGSEEATETISFRMFDASVQGIEKNMLVFKNRLISQVRENEQVCVKFDRLKINEEEVEDLFSDSTRYLIGYLNAEGDFVQAENVEFLPGGFLLRGIDCVAEDGIPFCVKLIDENRHYEISLTGITIYTGSEGLLPEVIYSESVEQDASSFLPFMDTITEYRECFIGSDAVFAKKCAKVELKFDLRFEKNQVGILQGTDIEFKHFMRRPNLMHQERELVEVVAQKIRFEYFNGTGWRRLLTQTDLSTLFCDGKGGEICVEFLVPEDIASALINAYELHWIKIVVLEAANSFLTPAIHTYPIIENLHMSYEFGSGVQPESVTKYVGVEKLEIMDEFKNGKEVLVFEPAYDSRDCLFIGLSSKIESGPVSIYFDVTMNSFMEDMMNVGFEYSSVTSGGFKALRVIDGTEGFRHSGCVVFNPPSDFVRKPLFGKNNYWLKIVNLCVSAIWGDANSIKVNDIKLNAVPVSNVQTMEEEIFYVDRGDANMSFDLSSGNVLQADVFVNEVLNLPLPEKERLLATAGESILTEMDTLGNYLDFFVRWQEVPSFVKSSSSDRHYTLDRQRGRITFGDSRHGLIPRNQPRAAVKVFYKVCGGARGNVAIGAISKPRTHINFLGDMSNIIPAYAGCDIENFDTALSRGSELICSCGRLVTKTDFEDAVLRFSGAIDKVKCVVGGGNSNSRITIAVLMKESHKSNEVFVSLRDEIREALMSKCDVSITRNDIHLVEPVFIKLNVDVWVRTIKSDQVFRIKNMMEKELRGFLDPVAGNFDKEGWQIGVLPQKPQLYSFLKTLNLDCAVNKIVLTGFMEGADRYSVDLERISTPVFGVVVSGDHNVHVN
ncbi:MAG: hypothetical protein LBJ38_02035 [Oscillospiraceae bacterium]|nr:hypothetical protein [Oscillospiraceae bacterium]